MKKIIYLIITVLLLVSCFGLTVGASELNIKDSDFTYDGYCELPADEKITFSEDYKHLYVGERVYSRFNTYDAYLDINYGITNAKIIDDETVSEVNLLANKKGNVIEANIYYKDGAELHCYFMDNNYLEEYENIVNDNVDELYINFSLKKDSYFKVNAEKLKTKKVTIKTEDFYYKSETFSVSAFTSDKSIEISRGEIHILRDRAYYDSGMNKDQYGEDGEEWILYEIRDKEFVEQLNAKTKEYYSDCEYGTFMDEDISKKITVPFFWICLIFVPLAVLIVSVIFFIRCKTKMYKRMYFITSIFAIVQTIIFVVCSIILF